MAVIVRLSRFRTMRPGFDAVLRATLLPGLRRRAGVLGVFAGRQGPDEIGARLIVTLWSSEEAMAAADDDGADELGDPAATTERRREVTTAGVVRLAPVTLPTGILRAARGRLRDTDMASYERMVVSELLAAQASGRGPSDLVMATLDERTFVMLSTWPDWSAIEEATGASVSEPLRTKRLAALETFEVDHYELLTDLVPGEPLPRA